MYVEDEQLNAYVLPIDPRMLKDGQYSYEGYQSLQPNTDLVWNTTFEVYVGPETTEIPLEVWPIPLCSTAYDSFDAFQRYSLFIEITSS